jgi:hypothetical protein
MIEDSVLKEVRAAREAYAKRHDFDVRKIVTDLQALDAVGDWPVVSFVTKPESRFVTRPVVAEGCIPEGDGASTAATARERDGGL